jgi:hypothetical protein
MGNADRMELRQPALSNQGALELSVLPRAAAPYVTPRLKHLGRVSELTRGQNSGPDDDLPISVAKHAGV